MPLYEYRCKDCRRRSTLLVRSMSSAPQTSCQHCGSGSLTRLISKFSFHRSWGGSLGSTPDSGYPDDLDQQDPRKMSQWMRRMQHEMGEEVSPEFEQMMEEMEAGGSEYQKDDLDDM